MQKEKFIVTGMTCAACQAHVQKAVSAVPGVQQCDVNLLSGTMQVAYDGALAGFRERLGSPRELVLDLAAPRLEALALPEGARTLAIEAEGIRHRIAFSGAELTVPALLTRIGAQAEVQDLSLTEPAVEDLVRRINAGDRPG